MKTTVAMLLYSSLRLVLLLYRRSARRLPAAMATVREQNGNESIQYVSHGTICTAGDTYTPNTTLEHHSDAAGSEKSAIPGVSR